MEKGGNNVTRPYTREHQLHAGGQGQYLRSLKHFDNSSEAKDSKEIKAGYVHWSFVPLVYNDSQKLQKC